MAARQAEQVRDRRHAAPLSDYLANGDDASADVAYGHNDNVVTG